MNIILHGDKIKSEDNFHTEAAKQFNFPDYYGKNLDAFWDCFSDFLISKKDEPIIFEWKDHQLSKDQIGTDRFASIMEIVKRGKEEWSSDMQIRLT